MRLAGREALHFDTNGKSIEVDHERRWLDPTFTILGVVNDVLFVIGLSLGFLALVERNPNPLYPSRLQSDLSIIIPDDMQDGLNSSGYLFIGDCKWA